MLALLDRWCLWKQRKDINYMVAQNVAILSLIFIYIKNKEPRARMCMEVKVKR